jgi:hypothetical protein
MRPPKPVDQELSTDDDCESLPPSRVSHDKNKPAASRVDSRGDDVRPSSVTLVSSENCVTICFPVLIVDVMNYNYLLFSVLFSRG